MLRKLFKLFLIAVVVQGSFGLSPNAIDESQSVVAGVFPPLTAEPHRVQPIAGVFPPLTEEPHRIAPVAGVFPPTEEEPHRIRGVAGVFPPETEEPRRVRGVAGVFPPETEEPRRVKAEAGVFPPEAEEPRRVKAEAGVFPPETEEPRRVRSEAGVFPPETEEPRRVSRVRDIAASASEVSEASVTPITKNPIPGWASDADVCSTKRSCDSCTESQYCKYTFSGKPQCCSAPQHAASERQGVYATSLD